jgi:hypothetical protein
LRFRLSYRGPLASNGKPSQKWDLRQKFHSQLEAVWKQEPLVSSQEYRDPAYQPDDCYLGETRNGATYLPLISEKIFTVAELDILMMRPGNPGSIAGGGGDIDNRLKTLFDALQPPNPTDTYCDPSWNKSTPISCLLQDDKLITRVNVETDRLLDGHTNDNEVLLVIAVHVRASSARMCNHFAS